MFVQTLMNRVVIHASICVGAFSVATHAQTSCDTLSAGANSLDHGGVVIDINKDGRPDLVTNRREGPAVLLGGGAGFTAVFSSGTTTGGIPGCIAVADFDKDGNLDVARGSYENDNPSLAKVVVNYGLGNGQFSGELVLGVGNWVTEVKAGDLDGDGVPDIICGTETTGIRVWKGRSGRSFSASATYASGSINRQSVLRDVNGDGRPDLVIVNETENRFSVLLNNGTGGFPSRTTYPTGSYPTGLVLADWDGDGFSEIAVAHRYTDEIWIHRNNRSGAFSRWKTIPSPLAGAAIGQLVSGDFDGDGDIDFLAVSGYGASQKYRSFASDGSGGFVAGATVPGTASNWFVHGASLDTDAKTDLFATEYYGTNPMMRIHQFFSICPGSEPVRQIAGPIFHPRTGHAYYLLSAGSWNDSQAFAVTLGGNLATVEDADENAFLVSEFGSLALANTAAGRRPSLWIGLNDQQHEGAFVWASGSTAPYRNFASGEPLGGLPDEDFVGINLWSGSSFPIGGWHDIVSDGRLLDTCFGIVEVHEQSNCPGDLDQSRGVDIGDLTLLLMDFGLCEGCIMDLDRSGAVDLGDVAVLLMNFGPCD